MSNTNMDIQCRKWLEDYDEDGVYEFPSDFDANDIELRAKLVFDDIKVEEQSAVFEDWIYHQDASFGLAIDMIDRNAGIRFSNFGNLVNLSGAERLPTQLLDTIYLSLDINDFKVIPTYLLQTPYDGVMQGDKCLPTWWVRYFDWI